MVLTSSRISHNNKENAHVKPCLKREIKGSLPRKRSHAVQPKTCLVPSRAASTLQTENLCSLLRENCKLSETPSKGSILQGKLRLPKTLRRPIFRPIAKQCLAAVEPGLARIPLEYIRQNLRNESERMYDAISKVVPKQNQDGTLPRAIEITTLDSSIELPTHILAVYSTPNATRKQISLHPVHSIILASQCAHLPPMLLISSNEPASLTLPVLPMRLPSPRTFNLLLRYLYTHRTSDILSALLPLPAHNCSDAAKMSSRLASAYNSPTLISLVSAVHGFWSNVAALGIFEDPLWEVIDFSWEVLLGALESKMNPGA
ncbi:hypothetical protein Clacol_010591 [Clathrus columnatus]|uniref:BTB domain-containing protein n=1 Tax=Clathrus columnatus TaxID=1419009 RepID=A0AAV5AT08_9AGAM|nr:hypothetical protein Clacol_009015 [Clathrus columnatus]GJJ16294.1 hypothetical protein Clacol_010591 [Clathrus columnatus]